MSDPHRAVPRISQQWYLEDFEVGQRWSSPSRTLTDAHYMAFAALSGDSMPIHYDREYASRHPFGRPVAHGLLMTALTALGGSEVAPHIHESIFAFVEQSSRFKKPLFVGDTVTPITEVVEVELRSAGKGLVRTRVSILDQDGDEALEGHHAFLVWCRDSAETR